jgi:uncharacterized protein involved in cysteine biosynthesis
MSDKSPTKDISFFRALRDIVFYSIDKGVFLPLILGVVLIIFAIRIPTSEISKIFSELLKTFHDWSYLGWILLPVCIVLWVISIRFLLSIHAKELGRVTSERNKFQDIVLSGKVKSSES